MNDLFSTAGLRPIVSEITQSVFETMLGLDVQAADASDTSGPDDLTAAVYYAGEWKGAFLVQCSTSQAADWACRLMSLEAPISGEDARDGLGEVTNMLAGNLKPFLPPGVGLSLPSVVQGSDYSIRICRSNLAEKMSFHDGTAPFVVTFVEVLNNA